MKTLKLINQNFNELFTDPSPKKPKALVIYYEDNYGVKKKVKYYEKADINITNIIKIIKSHYGYKKKS